MSVQRPVPFYTFEAIEALLPERPEESPKAEKCCTTKTIVAIALGAILVLGGLFLILSSQNLLPSGWNVMSTYNSWAPWVGGAAIALGLVVAALPHLCCKKQQEPKKEDEHLFLHSYLPLHLRKGEAIVLYDENREMISVYSQKQSGDTSEDLNRSRKDLAYPREQIAEAVNAYIKTSVHFVSMTVLQSRIKTFEKNKK